MPISKELTIRMEDRPGTLGKVCRALADQEVNILAFQSIPSEGVSLVRVVLDNPTTAKKVLDNQRVKYTETDVAQVELAHRPGELARAAAKPLRRQHQHQLCLRWRRPDYDATSVDFWRRRGCQGGKDLGRNGC